MEHLRDAYYTIQDTFFSAISFALLLIAGLLFLVGKGFMVLAYWLDGEPLPDLNNNNKDN